MAGKHHKGKEGHEEDIADIEDSLFSDAEDKEPEVGLIKKSKPSSHASSPKHHKAHAHHGYTRRKELKLSIPVPDRGIIMKICAGLVLLILIIFFFYNPFYCMFPWNKDQCSTISADDAEEELEVADEVNVTVGDDEAEEDEENTGEGDTEDETTDSTDTDDEDTGSSDEDNLDDLDDTSVDEDSDVIDLSGEVEFQLTKLPDISSKEWGWQVDKLYFSVDNQKEDFIPKLRVRIYEGSEQGSNLRSDDVKVYPELAVGKKLISSMEVIAMIGDADEDALVIMELKDEGDEPGLAEDKLIKKITETVNHPVT